MTVGIKTLLGDGSEFSYLTTTGSVCVGAIAVPSNQSYSQSFPRVPASALHYFAVEAGGHEITISAGGSGEAILTATALIPGYSQLLLFASKVTSSAGDYGALYVNDAGNVLVDSVYPVPQFRGREVMPAASSTIGFSSTVGYRHVKTISAGAGLERFVMWSLPDTGGVVGYNGTNYLGPSDNTLVLDCFSNSSSYQIPTAFVFAINPQAVGGYGMRVYGPSPENKVLFDTGGIHMRIKSIGNTLYYTDVPQSTSLPAGTAVPAVLLGNYEREWAVSGNISKLWRAVGTFSRSGGDIVTRRFEWLDGWEDARVSYNNTYGSYSNKVVVIDAAPLGG